MTETHSQSKLMKPARPWREVLREWAPELAQKLGRPVSEIETNGLTANDFSPACSVEVRHPDGSEARFGFAFAVVRSQTKEAAVFSEHDGYLEFALIEDAIVAEIHEHIYRQE